MNNSENKNNELNTISLGSATSSDTLNLNVPLSEIPPVAPIETIDSLDNNLNIGFDNNMNNEIPPLNTENLTNVNNIPPVAPVTPINYDVPETINNFSTTPVFNDIGTVPPIPDSPIGPIGVPNNDNLKPPKKDKGIPKVLFVLIIVLSITAVGVGVYIFLHVANKNAVMPRMIRLEAGSEISTNINDYATL